MATLSWRAAFVVLAVPAFALAWAAFRLPEPKRLDESAREETDELWLDAGGGAHPRATDAQQLAQEHGIEPDPALVLRGDVRRMGLISATRYVLRVRTNVILIAASACGYYFIAGVQTFGVEFAKDQYGVGQALANVLLLVVGIGAVLGVLAGGIVGDLLVRRRHLNGRVIISAAGMALMIVAAFGMGNAAVIGAAVAFLIVFGVGWGFFDCNNMPILCQIVPPGLRATGYGIMNLVSTSCGGLADWGFGAMRDRDVPLNVIFGVFASAGILSVVLVLLIRPRDNLWRVGP